MTMMEKRLRDEAAALERDAQGDYARLSAALALEAAAREIEALRARALAAEAMLELEAVEAAACPRCRGEGFIPSAGGRPIACPDCRGGGAAPKPAPAGAGS